MPTIVVGSNGWDDEAIGIAVGLFAGVMGVLFKLVSMYSVYYTVFLPCLKTFLLRHILLRQNTPASIATEKQ